MHHTPAHATPHAVAPACARHCENGLEPCPTPFLCGLNSERWPFHSHTDRQRAARVEFELAARNNELRGLPSAFGELV